MRDPRDVIIKPVISEKSYAQAESGKYTFVVHPDATKPDVRRAVETIWNVQVASVTTMKRKGKAVRNRRTFQWGKRPDTKRAVVTLEPGHRIEIYQTG